MTPPEFLVSLFAAVARILLHTLASAREWLLEWLLSPGFGGAAAVLAAAIAFVAARRQAEVNRAAGRKEQWWKRAEWALDLTLSDKSEDRVVGLDTLDALSRSEWAAEHEGDVIAAATEWALGPAPLVEQPAEQPAEQLDLQPADGQSDDAAGE